MQVFCLWTTSFLIYVSIQYAKVLQEATYHKVLILNIMKAESDFYNIVSGVELKGMFLDTFVAISIIYTQWKYNQICNQDVPSFVAR